MRPPPRRPCAVEPLTRGFTRAAGAINVDVTSGHALNKFTPADAIGAGIDAIGIGGESTLFTKSNIATMLSSGLQSISYRLYTELNVQDWHWNPVGTWSDSANKKGYFVGNYLTTAPIKDSYGYQLLHRGSTFDQGDNQDYSKIVNGDTNTYWKSNPYLTSYYTKESDYLHQQWVMLDLGSTMPVNAIKIAWANPYAVTYQVQYWNGDDALYNPGGGSWVPFSTGTVTKGVGGTVTLQLSKSNVSAEFIRVVMAQSSGTYSADGKDPRNAMGYAIYEIGVGTVNSKGQFTDLVTHVKDQTQTAVYASSTDPFATSTAQNTATEQAGLDFIFASNGASRGLPAMVPVPMVYSNPDTAVAEAAYLFHKRLPILGLELGEEPDGQFMTPEDYGALWVQWATTLHAHFPQYKLGGPVLSDCTTQTWANSTGETDWLRRFVMYLKGRNALSLLGFISTEHYPFTATKTSWSLLGQEPAMVKTIFDELTYSGLPATFPTYVTEFNFDAVTTEVPVDLMGALWHAIFVGEFMNRGGAGSYYYQYLPSQFYNDGNVFGILGMFPANDNDQITSKAAQFFSSQLMSQQWCVPGSGLHSILPAKSNVTDSHGNLLVYPYAVLRPDGQYGLMLVNADSVAHTVTVTFNDKTAHVFTGSVAQSQFSAKDYLWKATSTGGSPKPDGPFEQATVNVGKTTSFTLPAESITVLHGKIQ